MIPLRLTTLADRLLALGVGIYAPDAVVSDTAPVHIDVDPQTLATTIRSHAATVTASPWAMATVPGEAKEMLAPLTPGQLAKVGGWDGWLDTRSRLMLEGDAISHRWLHAVFTEPADPGTWRAGWSHLDFSWPQRGGNIIRALRECAAKISTTGISALVEQLTTTSTQDGVTNLGTMATSDVPAARAWLALIGLAALPATPTGGTCMLGYATDNIFTVPLAPGRLGTLIDDTIPLVDCWMRSDPLTRSLPTSALQLEWWETTVRKTGPSVVRYPEPISEDTALGRLPQLPTQALNTVPLTSTEVRAIRQMCGLSVSEMAGMLSISDRTIRRWEDGRAIPSWSAANAVWGLVADLETLAGTITAYAAGHHTEQVDVSTGEDTGASYVLRSPVGAVRLPRGAVTPEWATGFPDGFVMVAAAKAALAGVRLL